MMVSKVIAVAACLALLAMGRPALADGSVRIAVMNDQSGNYNTATGPGAVVAAKMAAEDFGGKVLGRPVEVVALDHQNKPDVGLALAKQFYSEPGGDAVFDIGNSAISLAVQALARDQKKIVVHIGSIHPDLFGKSCSPTGAMWQYDSSSLTKGLVQAVTESGGKNWFIIAVDYVAGKALADDEARNLAAAGGRVVGIARHPLGASDFSSQLLTAASSGADTLALASFGGDAENLIKQANEFHIGMRLVAPLLTIADIKALGPEEAHGITYTTAFYWDRTDATRAFGKRFSARFGGNMPTEGQAATYSAVLHYLQGIAAAGSDDGPAVMAKMKAAPVDDFYAEGATLRSDGRLMKDMFLVQAKNAADVKSGWDLLDVLKRLKAADIIRPLSEGGCMLPE